VYGQQPESAHVYVNVSQSLYDLKALLIKHIGCNKITKQIEGNFTDIGKRALKQMEPMSHRLFKKQTFLYERNHIAIKRFHKHRILFTSVAAIGELL